MQKRKELSEEDKAALIDGVELARDLGLANELLQEDLDLYEELVTEKGEEKCERVKRERWQQLSL